VGSATVVVAAHQGAWTGDKKAPGSGRTRRSWLLLLPGSQAGRGGKGLSVAAAERWHAESPVKDSESSGPTIARCRLVIRGG